MTNGEIIALIYERSNSLFINVAGVVIEDDEGKREISIVWTLLQFRSASVIIIDVGVSDEVIYDGIADACRAAHSDLTQSACDTR